MPVAMATVLQCYIVLFKTDGNNRLYVSPQVAPLMVYNPKGAGHYDASKKTYYKMQLWGK
jgi:hypothetical protein